MAAAAGVSANMGVRDWEISDGSDLVVLSVLAAVVLQQPVSSEPGASGVAADHCVHDVFGGQRGRRVAADAVSQAGLFGGESATGGDAGMRMRRGADFYGGLSELRVGGDWVAGAGDSGASGVVSEYSDDDVGYVSEERGGVGGGHRDERGIGGRHAAGR